TPVTVPHVAGDYNYDGVVDAADYVGWKYEYGRDDITYPDGNNNGVVDAADYVVWRKNLGQTSANGAGTNRAVPEPAGSAILIISSMTICLLRRRRSG